MSRILIVGGAGYVGQRVAPHLVSRGHDVAIVDRMLLDNPLPHNSGLLIWDDLFNLDPEALSRYDTVIFLAGLSNDPMANFSPAENYVQNAAAPGYLAWAAKQAKVKRFIYASSCSIYGDHPESLAKESDPVNPSFPYGLSKLVGEKAVLQLADDSFEVIALRKGTISGYSPRMRFDLCINAMYKDAVTKGTVTVNNGDVYRPILAMTDAVDAYTRAVECTLPLNPILVNVASLNYRMSEVGSIVAACFSLRPTINQNPELRNYRVRLDRAAYCLGFKPQTTISDIVYELKEQCEGMDLDDDRWYNLRSWRKHANSHNRR